MVINVATALDLKRKQVRKYCFDNRNY